jgi:hypothetical protein
MLELKKVSFVADEKAHICLPCYCLPHWCRPSWSCKPDIY